MKKYKNDTLYIKEVNDILENEEFKRLKTIMHHGGTRYDHSIRVSYHSYKICKFLHLHYKEVARASLLHDFFFEDNLKLNKKERIKVLVNHPFYAYSNAKKYYNLSNLEENIITSHMFPIGKIVPKYLESWIVDIVDDFDAIYEKGQILLCDFSTAWCFLFLLLLNISDNWIVFLR